MSKTSTESKVKINKKIRQIIKDKIPSEMKEYIRDNWIYVCECMENSMYKDIEIPFSTRKYVIGANKDLDEGLFNESIDVIYNILQLMMMIIMKSHVDHNNYLMGMKDKMYPCPNHCMGTVKNHDCDCDIDSDCDCDCGLECYAYPSDKKTRGCGVSIKWSTAGIDFTDKDAFNIYSRKCVGQISINKS